MMQLLVDVEGWLARLKRVNWGMLEPDVDSVVHALLGLLGEDESKLAKRIHDAVGKVERGPGGECQIFIVLDGYRDTGELLAFEIAVGHVLSPDHVHGSSPDADYGERYWTLDGYIDDVTDAGEAFRHRPIDPPVTHGPNSRHQPEIDTWWVGVFYQPAGSMAVASTPA